jgi:hypothetical protein
MKLKTNTSVSKVHQFEVDLEDEKFEVPLKVEVRIENKKITNFFYVNFFRFGRMTEAQEDSVKKLIKDHLIKIKQIL